jgi:hypothetical protein
MDRLPFLLTAAMHYNVDKKHSAKDKRDFVQLRDSGRTSNASVNFSLMPIPRPNVVVHFTFQKVLTQSRSSR